MVTPLTHEHTLMQLTTVTHYQPTRCKWHWQWCHLQGHGFKDQDYRQHFPKMHFSGGSTYRSTIRWRTAPSFTYLYVTCVRVMCAVLRRPVSPDDAGRFSDERRAYLGDTQELHRRRPPAVVCRQGYHVRLADLNDTSAAGTSSMWSLWGGRGSKVTWFWRDFRSRRISVTVVSKFEMWNTQSTHDWPMSFPNAVQFRPHISENQRVARYVQFAWKPSSELYNTARVILKYSSC